MEPVPSILSAIFKVLQQIAKAEGEARRNRTRCRHLAERAEVVSNFVRDAARKKPAGSKNDAAAATRHKIMCRLREALDDALKLIESCGQCDDSSGGCVWPWLSARLSSGARAARLDDVHNRINSCLIEYIAASGACMEKKIDGLVISARDHHPGTNKKKENKAGNAPQKGATGQGGQNGGKGSKKRRGKKKKNAAASGSRPPPPLSVAHAAVCFHQSGHVCTTYRPHYHSVEDDPNSCSVM